jgi:hypothetical protein
MLWAVQGCVRDAPRLEPATWRDRCTSLGRGICVGDVIKMDGRMHGQDVKPVVL